MFSKLKQIQEMRKKARELKNTLSQERAFGSALEGKIQIEMTGNQEIEKVTIDPSLLSTDQKEKLEEGVKDAFKNALKEIQHIMARKVQSGELELPKF
ncbi:MAG: YbaB/EbfC family nucleoid-associated protein [Patescibacteria group bacterium]